MILANFTLQVVSPTERIEDTLDRQDAGVLMNLARFIVETEENLTDLLPEGYLVKIREEHPHV